MRNKKQINRFLKECEERGKKVKITGEDWNNLYDLLEMASTPKEIPIDLADTIRLNKMDKWVFEFLGKVEDVVIEPWGENVK
jgi:hypothetical protein